MGKRSTALGPKKKSTRSHKTAKRLAVKKDNARKPKSKKEIKIIKIPVYSGIFIIKLDWRFGTMLETLYLTYIKIYVKIE